MIGIRPITTDAQVIRASELEAAGYPEDEAASLETLRFRFKAVPELFLGAFAPQDQLVGFIVATLTTSERLTHDSMSEHEPEGSTAAVHSVCVDDAFRRKGIALDLLSAFKQQCLDLNKKNDGFEIKRIALIAKKGLVPLYEKAGFKLLGLSEVVHGADQWHELQMDL